MLSSSCAELQRKEPNPSRRGRAPPEDTGRADYFKMPRAALVIRMESAWQRVRVESMVSGMTIASILKK